MLLLCSAARFPASSLLPLRAASARAASEVASTAAACRYSSDAHSKNKTEGVSTKAEETSSKPTLLRDVLVCSFMALAFLKIGVQKQEAPTPPPKSAAAAQAAQQVECALDSKNYHPYTLKSTRDVTHNTKVFTFALPDPTKSLGLPVASCVMTRFTKTDGDGSVVRPYTPISTDDDKGIFDLLIKHYVNGPMSEHIFAMEPGDTLDVKGPMVKIEYKPNRWKKIGMIAGGTGLTPMLQVIRKILSNPEDKTEVSLLFANQEERDIILKSELDTLARQHPYRLQVHYTVDKPSENWTGEKGFVSKSMIQKYMPGKLENAIIFVCGPQGMMAHVSGTKTPDFQQGEVGGILAELGYKKDKVFKF